MGHVRVEQREGVLEIVLDKPEALNAFDWDMVATVRDAVGAAQEDPAVGAILLTGTGRGFCAGMDLTSVTLDGDPADVGPATQEAMETGLGPLIAGLATGPTPVVTAVNGVAAGAGVGLALAGDLVLAASSARFVLVFAPNLAIAPDGGTTWLLPHLAGRARARGMALLGEPVDAATAHDWGLLWEVVDDASLLERARGLARRLAAGPTAAFSATTRLLDEAWDRTLPEQLSAEARTNGRLTSTEEFRSRVAGFLESRRG